MSSFWRGKRVFVTGHTGFKGAWLCLFLTKLEAEVTGYALHPPTDPNLYQLCGIEQIIKKSYIHDIRDAAHIERAMKEAEPDVVIHMAAQPLVLESYNNPVDTYSINVMGTIHVLEAVRACNSVRAVVNVTTDKCYENKEWIWGYREDEPMGGHDPYSSSKACSELVTSAYRKSFFHGSGNHAAIASARAGNVIGGGDWAPNRLIPDCMNSLIAGTEIYIRNPGSIRPWQHVLEPLSGYLLVAQRLYEHGDVYASAWNFGPSDSDVKTVKWTVEKLCELWGRNAQYKVESTFNLHEAQYLKLDCSKAATQLNWRPRWNLSQALEKIVEWTTVYQAQGNIREISCAQIEQYLSSAEGRL